MYVDMPISRIHRNPDQPRKNFDAEKLEELAGSIAANGLLEPIVVRPVAEDYLIVAGERRWRASQQAGLAEVPVRIMEIGEADAYVLSVAENVNRADMSEVEEADSFAQLQAYGKDVDEIARLFGKSAEYVRIRLSFRDLIPEARTLLERGEIRPNLARYIADLKPGNQRAVTSKWARGEFQHEIDAAHFARALKQSEEEVGFFDMEEPTAEERETHQKKARAARSTSDQIARLAALLDEVADADAAELATALGDEVHARLADLDGVVKRAQAARQNMRRAKAHAEARTIALNPQAVA